MRCPPPAELASAHRKPSTARTSSSPTATWSRRSRTTSCATRRRRTSRSSSLEIRSGALLLRGCYCPLADAMLQCHYPRRPAFARRSALNSVDRHPQRVRHERRWSCRPRAVQLWPDGLDSILHRDLEARQLAGARAGERRARTAHAVLARHQGQGAERGEPGEVRGQPWVQFPGARTDRMP